MSWTLYQKARDRLARERGAITKAFGGKLTFALAYPNTYHVGMSNLGFQKVYALLNQDPEVLCERAFLPDPPDLAQHQQSQVPLFSLESQTPLSKFEVVAFSLSFETDFLYVLKILELARIPLKTEERAEHHPLVVCGGIAATFNPEPLAAFVDLFLIGEGEAILPGFLSALKQSQEGGEGHEAFLQRLATCPGVYVPSAYQVRYHPDGRIEEMIPQPGFPATIQKWWLKDLDSSPTASVILTPDTEFSQIYLVEVSRGCSRRCHFCVAGHSYQPLRFYRTDTLRAQIAQGLAQTRKIGLVGVALTEIPGLLSLCQEIVAQGGQVCPASLRMEGISPPLMELLAAGGQRAVALAPEAGTERLRRMIRKNFSEEEIVEKVSISLQGGIAHFKLYFLVGLPTEGPEDVEAIVELTKKIQHIARKSGQSRRRPWTIQLSINPFVPKPFTPFQWEPMEEVRSLQAKLKAIKGGLAKVGQVQVFHDGPKWSFVQALLSRGDRRVGDLLYAAHRLGGDWYRAFREVNLNPEFYVYRPREEEEHFPWDHLDLGVSKRHLLAERKRTFSP
ncbi:MAG: radical SAM protein [Candidatus Tectomicrobia bacterium]|uniref:Radical SAM protein n=1 Tax=Tectimicrobiota bacterium TaxID=2528274 RepID=A0A932CQE7_UNCTE|nr:radical SAM protein [Candidatus Tectomicrobia bacterium]